MWNNSKINGLFEYFQRIDRRILYLLVAAGVFWPTILPMGLPVMVTPPVQMVFDKIQTLPAGSTILISFDYGPDVSPELAPMGLSILRQCFSRDIRVIGLSLMPLGGPEMADSCLHQAAFEFSKVYGVDYVNLGYKSGSEAVMLQMNENIPAVFPQDYSGLPTSEMLLMQQVTNYSEISLIVDLASTILGEWWITLVNARFGIPLAIGTTAVYTPKYYAYLASAQIFGLIGGMKGASEYEKLVHHYEKATAGMDAQTVVHLIIMVFIIVGNVSFLLTKKKRR